MSFNVYEDPARAESYAALDFPGTYYLAFRDLPEVFVRHVTGSTALDFGCGAGRSTRFLKSLGFESMGIDISASMIEQARKRDPDGRYLLVQGPPYPDDLGRFDLIFSGFAFDNIPGVEHRCQILEGLKRHLAPSGKIVLLGSTPLIYVHEWASFSTADFPENRTARSGDEVKTVMKDVVDARPVVDLLWTHADYVDIFGRVDLRLLEARYPLGREDEGIEWISETHTAPWVIYVLS